MKYNFFTVIISKVSALKEECINSPAQLNKTFFMKLVEKYRSKFQILKKKLWSDFIYYLGIIFAGRLKNSYRFKEKHILFCKIPFYYSVQLPSAAIYRLYCSSSSSISFLWYDLSFASKYTRFSPISSSQSRNFFPRGLRTGISRWG